MKSKRFVSVAAAILSALLINCGVFAAGSTPQYQEATLNFAQNGHGDTRLTDFTAGPNGHLHYFIKEDTFGKAVTPTQFESKDYGQTWKQVDMSWFSEMEKRYPGFGVAQDFHIAGNGDIYFIATIGNKEETVRINGEDVLKHPRIFGVFKYTGGKIQQIPNLVMGNYYQPFSTIEHVYENGDILISRINTPKATIETMGFALYSADGKLKNEVSMKDFDWLPTVYSSDNLYGIRYGDDQPEDVSACNVKTGQKTAIPFAKEQTTEWVESVGVSPNGTVYVALTSGLYKCEPGGKSFTKLIGGADYHFSKNATTSRLMACADDGTIYVQGFYLNESNLEDPNNEMLGKLYRYQPITK